MGRQTGLIKLTGTIGGVSFYKSDGKYYARVANGPSKDRIASSPEFKRTRENNKEFGGSATMAKALRVSLASAIHSMSGRQMVPRLTAIFKSINIEAPGVRGQRPILLSQHSSLLNGFDFDKALSITSVFSAPYSVTANTDRNEITYDVPSFVPVDFIDFPDGATHFKLIAAVGVLSDYEYDTGSDKYQPKDDTINTLSVYQPTAVQPIGTTPVAINEVVSLPGAPVPGADVSVVACVGIEFYQEVSGTHYLFAQSNALRIAEIF